MRWVNHNGVGYFFLTPVSNATISTITQSGNWYAINQADSSANISLPVFSLDLNHGVRPSGASYVYVVVPGITATSMDAYLASNAISITENDATAQVVTQNLTGMTQATLYSPTTITLASGALLTQTTAGEGSSVLAQLNGSTMVISVASPQAWSGAMIYRINGDYSGTNAVWNTSGGYTTLSFALPSGSSAGSTITQSFQLISSSGSLTSCYFTGGIDGKWNTLSSGSSNFATTPVGTTNAASMPSSQTDVYLDANSAGNLTTTPSGKTLRLTA